MMRPTAWLLLLAAFGARVEAQTQMTCAASAVQKNVRSEGDTELVADVVLRCTGGVPTVNGGAIPPATFTLAFNANVTSRILGGTSASEALLLLDEPAPGQQFPCDQASGVCPGYGNGNGSGYYGGGVQAPKTPNNRNVFQGYVGAIGVAAGGGNVLTWSNIPIDSPGSGTRVYRFTNIRLNVSSLAGKLPQLTGISLSGQIGSVPIAPTSLTLGTTLTSLSTSVRDAGDANSAPNGVTVPLALGGANTVRYATLRFAGQYQSAARPRTTAPFINADSSPPPTTPQNNPGTVYDSESGFYNPSFGTYAGGNLGLAGLADSGPRFMAVFSNIPAGFTISVDLYNSTSASGPTARLVNTASNGSGPFSPASGNGTVATLAPVNGSVTAVWEVLRDTTQASDQYDFGVYLTYGSGAAVPPPIAVQMEYAPFLANSAPSIPLFNGVASGQTLMTFTSAPILAVTPASLAFTGTAGGPSPAPQALGINATSPVSFSVASGGVLPLNIQPASGITPQSVFVSLNTQGMAAGTYKDTITVQSQAALPVQVPVTLTLNPAPAITSISPQSALAGGPGFTLTVNGANFSNPATVIWNNTALPTSFAGSTQLTAQVAASLIATPGTATIVVVLSDGSTSNSVNFTISSLTITAINPSSVVAGSAAFTLTITGSGFAQGDSVTVGSASLTPSSLTATQIAVTVSANLIAQAGSLPVTVTTPGGAKSNSVTLTITSSPITITSISPNSVVAGSAAFNMTVTGSGFVQGSSVTVGSASLTPSSLTATQIVVTVPANLIAQAGSLPVTVTTADGRTSNSVTLAVTNPAVTITAISPTSVAAGGAAFTLTVTGSGFLQGATVTVGNATLTPASLTATQITVSVPANLIAQAGSLGVTVTTPDGRTSNSVPLTLAAPFMLTSLSPATVIATGPAFTLTIAGVGFASGATVQVGSATLQPATVTSTQITVSVPAASIAQTGTLQVTVTNPNNVISNALPLTAGAVPAITSVSPSSVLPGAAAFTLTVTGTGFTSGSVVQWNGQALATAVAGATQLTTQVPASLVAAAGSATVAVITSGVSSNTVQFKIALPPLTNVSVSAPSSAPSGQDQSLTVNLGASYPVDLQGKLTLTFAGDGGLPDDPAIQFQNQSRVFTFTVPAGTTPQPVQVTVKTGTVSGVITITPAFTASGTDVTPSGIAPQHIQIARAAPQITSVTCSRSGSSFTTVIDGFTNTREATQGTFDFQAATGASLGTTELIVPATSLFSGWFGSSAAATAGGLFRYTQPFNVQGSATAVAAVSVKLTNATGTSAAVSCQLQ